MTTAAVPIEQALASPQLLGAAFGDLSTWLTWTAVIKASYGRRLTDGERVAFAKVAGGRSPPNRKVRRACTSVSRRAGKGRAAAAMLVYEGVLVDRSRQLSPGETGVCAAISPTRDQARVLLDYALGFLQSSPLLQHEIEDITNDQIRLRNGNTIETLSGDYRSLRGRTLLIAILDEASFLRDDQSSNPDKEIARALAPGLSTCNGTLWVMSSPYRRRGLVFELIRDHLGKDDNDTLVVTGESLAFNPRLDVEMIAAARRDDPMAAAAEWDGQFRPDTSPLLDDALVDAAIDHDRPLELPPRDGKAYVAGVDMSAGRHDRSTYCVMHAEGDGDNRRFVVDLIRGFDAPHDPATATREFAKLCTEYRVQGQEIRGDNFAGEWVAAAFREAGVNYVRSPSTRSELYLEALPAFARAQISIPNHPILTRELRLLERRTTRSGRDSVDHGTGAGASDDFANAMVCALAALQPRYGKGAAVMEFYRRQVAGLSDPVAAAGAPMLQLPRDEDFGFALCTLPPPRPHRFKVPAGTSSVYGIDGRQLEIVNGLISVTADECAAYRRLSWEELS